MTRPFRRSGLILAIALGAVAMSGCARLRGHQGYVVDVDLVNSVQPGVDNRTSVVSVLGKPTFTGQFEANDWYYVSRDTRYYAYNNPRAQSQVVLRIQFDDKGVVKSVDRKGIEQVASINPYGKITPTLGRKRTFFQELFGNIGTVGSGVGQGGGPGQDGGRDTP